MQCLQTLGCNTLGACPERSGLQEEVSQKLVVVERIPA